MLAFPSPGHIPRSTHPNVPTVFQPLDRNSQFVAPSQQGPSPFAAPAFAVAFLVSYGLNFLAKKGTIHSFAYSI
jgi:hypothetical protein